MHFHADFLLNDWPAIPWIIDISHEQMNWEACSERCNHKSCKSHRFGKFIHLFVERCKIIKSQYNGCHRNLVGTNTEIEWYVVIFWRLLIIKYNRELFTEGFKDIFNLAQEGRFETTPFSLCNIAMSIDGNNACFPSYSIDLVLQGSFWVWAQPMGESII